MGVFGSRDYTRFSDAATDVTEARIYQGIHFRSADLAGRSAGQRVSRWAYKHYLRSLDGDDFDFVRSLDSLEDLGDVRRWTRTTVKTTRTLNNSCRYQM